MTPRAKADHDQRDAQPNPDDASIAVGDVLDGKYRIEGAIAEGGMGVVLRATHLDLDAVVAIKLIHPDHVANDDIIARLLAEARIAASLRSKHVNHVLDVGRTPGGLPYLVLEYMRGSDLGEYAERRGPLPVSEAADLLMQACEALAEAHAVGIVHRDLKPENLFLCEDADGGFVLKVLDFGISKAPAARRGGRRLTNPFELVGSPTYMAPEQILGSTVDARADIWALGAVLYELCTGDILFDGDSKTEIFAKILTEQALPPPLDVGRDSPQLRDVLGKCLERNIEQRYQDVVELAAALAPLGTDGLQAERVAKVASASRARAIAHVAATPFDLAIATPVALSMTRIEDENEQDDADAASLPRRRAWPWIVSGIAAMFPLLGGLEYAHVHDAAVAPTSAGVADATEQPPKPPLPAPVAAPSAEPQETRPIAASSATVPAPVVTPAVTAQRRSWPPRAATATAALAWHAPEWATPAPEPVPHQPAVEAVSLRTQSDEPAPPAASQMAASDAWDPKNFGGRR